MRRATAPLGRRARPVAHVPPSHDRWLVSYADFMTLLFAFFVVLFASSRHSNQSLHRVAGAIHDGFSNMSVYAPDTNARPVNVTERSPAPVSTPGLDLQKLRRQLDEVLGDSIARHEIVVEQRADGLVISLRELGFFDSGQAQLLPGAADKIRRTARVLAEHQLQIKIEGHSDDQPIHTALFHSNWELSSARAMTVLLLLVNDGGFDPSRVSLSAYGPYRPLGTNSTPEGRRTNRRVDLVIVSPTQPPAGASGNGSAGPSTPR